MFDFIPANLIKDTNYKVILIKDSNEDKSVVSFPIRPVLSVAVKTNSKAIHPSIPYLVTAA